MINNNVIFNSTFNRQVNDIEKQWLESFPSNGEPLHRDVMLHFHSWMENAIREYHRKYDHFGRMLKYNEKKEEIPVNIIKSISKQ